jgi:hypothetical protein
MDLLAVAPEKHDGIADPDDVKLDTRGLYRFNTCGTLLSTLHLGTRPEAGV